MMELAELEKKYEELGKEIERLKKAPVGFKDDPIFLLSVEEYEKYKSNIPIVKDCWLLRTPGSCDNLIHYVIPGETVSSIGVCVYNDSDCIRPALKLFNIKFPVVFPDKSHIVFCGATWVNIYNDLYIAEMPIAYHRFDEKSNNYENSEIRKFLLDWYEERKNWQ